VLPYALRGDAADFPTVHTWSGNQGVHAFKREVADRELAEDRRLAYVAMTRAARRLVVTGHRWGPSQQKARKLSRYLATLHESCEQGLGTVISWFPEPADGESNPALDARDEYPWPVVGDARAAAARRDGAALVLRAMESPSALPPHSSSSGELSEGERQLVASWDRDIEALVTEARRTRVDDPALPTLMSATSAVQVLREPSVTRRRLQRPLPSAPAEAARRGTRFHQWVEARFGQVPLIDLDGLGQDAAELDGELDAGPEAGDLATLQQAFLAGPFADRQPVAVEAPFQMVLGDASVAGRIDAVYRVDAGEHSLPQLPPPPPGTMYEVVDWKTGRHPADELQLALYRLAWAELNGLPVDAVAASFYYVATGKVERPQNLPGREELTERWVASTT